MLQVFGEKNKKKTKRVLRFQLLHLLCQIEKQREEIRQKKKRKGRFLNKCNFAYAGHDTVNISLSTLKRSTSSSTDVRK